MKVASNLKRIAKFVNSDIWKIAESDLSKSRRSSYRFVKILILTIRGFFTHNLPVRASALTYSILFAIIPLFALIIAIAKGFGMEKLIEKSLEGTFIGEADLTPTVMGFVQRYLESTQHGLFIGIGLVILLGSVMNFFMQVERAFNSIWQVKKSRALIRQFTTYFSSVLLVPIFIVLSGGISFYINTKLDQSFIYDVFSPFIRFGVKLTPYLVNSIIFTIIYIVIPNTKVLPKNAMIAGIIAGTSFQAFQSLYIHGQIYLTSFNVVYGSFAAFPLLLLWLQISCTIILLGAEISYASQNFQDFEYEVESKQISRRYKNFLTLYICYLIVKQFEKIAPALNAEQISLANKLPVKIVKEILFELVEASILVETYSRNNESKTYLPAIDIQQLTLNLLFSKLEMNGTELFLKNRNDSLDAFWRKTMELKNRSDKPNEQVLVKDL